MRRVETGKYLCRIRVDEEIVKTVETKIWKKSLTYSLCDNLKTIDASASKNDICQINLGQIFASYNISHSLLQQIFVLQHLSVVVTTNIWFSHCYNLFAFSDHLIILLDRYWKTGGVSILLLELHCLFVWLFVFHILPPFYVGIRSSIIRGVDCGSHGRPEREGQS